MPVVVYSLLRLAVLAACVGLLALLGLRGWLLAIVAVVVAALASYLVLPRPRRAAAAWLAERGEARRRARAPRRDLDAEVEDATLQQAPAVPDERDVPQSARPRPSSAP